MMADNVMYVSPPNFTMHARELIYDLMLYIYMSMQQIFIFKIICFIIQ